MKKVTKKQPAKESRTLHQLWVEPKKAQPKRTSDSMKGFASPSNYLQAIIDSLEDELMVIDRDYRIIGTNEAVLLRHGKHRHEVIGQHCYEISHDSPEPCRVPDHECPIKAVWETGKPAQATHVHVYYVKGERRERYVDIIASPIIDDQGDVIAVTELTRDVTEAKERLEASRKQLHSLLAHLESLREEERKKMARDLHDETSQDITSLSAILEVAASMLPAGANKTEAILRKAQALSIHILDDIHRLISELRPTLLDDLGLVAAIRWLIDNNLEAAGITANFETVGRVKRLAPQLEINLFRVIQEAVSNIARHAHARNANVSLHFKKSVIRVCVRDDGRGFDVEEAINSEDRPRGLGLLGMKERAELMNGTLDIQSRLNGGGTKIDIKIPLN